MTKRLHQNNGFTIIELLIAVGIASVLITAIMIITLGFYGNILIEGQKSRLTLESTQILRTFTEQLRTASSIRTTPVLADTNAPAGGWNTSDPNNVLIISTPTVDSDNAFIIDTLNDVPYESDVIFFQDGMKLKRRYLVPTGATGSRYKTTCPTATSTCPADGVLTENFQGLTFTFYDINSSVTTTATNARSILITVTLQKKVAGKTVSQSNTVRMTLRNNL